jgi:hypothetical protein
VRVIIRRHLDPTVNEKSAVPKLISPHANLPKKTGAYRNADKSLTRPTSWCIFLVVRIFRLMLVLLYI